MLQLQTMARETLMFVGPYPLGEPGGVASVVNKSRPYFEKRFDVFTAGPTRRGRQNPANVATGEVLFDVTFRGTRIPVAYVYPGVVREAIFRYKPAVVLIDEPALAISDLRQIPTRSDRKLISATFGRHHAQDENEDGFQTQALEYLSRPLRRDMRKLAGRLAVSHSTERTVSRYFPGDPIKVIPNGVDTTQFKPEGPHIEEWEKDGKKTFLFVGRIEEKKGVEYLIRAFAKVFADRKDIQLKIAGPGDTEKLRELVQDFGLPQDSVSFLGAISDGDLKKAYRTATASVFPSTRGEGFGIVILEALASGSLVIASNINGYDEATEGGKEYALLAKPADPDDLARVMIEVLEYPDRKRDQLKIDARAHAVRYDLETIVGLTCDYLETGLAAYGISSEEEWKRTEQRVREQARQTTIFEAGAVATVSLAAAGVIYIARSKLRKK